MDREKFLQFLYEERHKLREELSYARREREIIWANELKEQIGVYRHIIRKVESGQFQISAPTVF